MRPFEAGEIETCEASTYVVLEVTDNATNREAAAIKMVELTTQARICLGRATAEEAPRTTAQPESGVRRRDERRDPTVDAEPIHRGVLAIHRNATEPESRGSDAEGSDSSNGRHATEPETDVDPPSTASGVRVATGARDGVHPDTAARAQWKSLLAR